MSFRKGSIHSCTNTQNRPTIDELQFHVHRKESTTLNNENYSLMNEILMNLKDKRRFSDFNVDEMNELKVKERRKISEAIDMINQNDQGFKPKDDGKEDDFQGTLYNCYCTIF